MGEAGRGGAITFGGYYLCAKFGDKLKIDQDREYALYFIICLML